MLYKWNFKCGKSRIAHNLTEVKLRNKVAESQCYLKYCNFIITVYLANLLKINQIKQDWLAQIKYKILLALKIIVSTRCVIKCKSLSCP